MARPPPNPPSGSATPAALCSNAPTPSSTSTTVRPPSGPPQPLNLPHMIQMDKEGKLSQEQTQTLREVITKQCRNVVASAILRGQPNPMNNLPPHLIPYSSHGGFTPKCTKEQWDAAIANGYADAKRLAEMMSLAEIKRLLAYSAEERTRMFAADNVLKMRFTRALNTYAQSQASRTNAPAGTPATPVAPGPQRMETEEVRRKRKFAELLKDEAGMQAELGVHDVLGEILDTFVETETLKAMRVAKHRKSNRIEIKDMAFAINDSTGITVPGFNILPRDRVRVSEGDKKRRTVVPLRPRTKKDDV